jgi:hypothetical protein
MTVGIRTIDPKTTISAYDTESSTHQCLSTSSARDVSSSIVGNNLQHPFRDEGNAMSREIIMSNDDIRLSSNGSPTNINPAIYDETIPVPVISPSPSLRIQSPEVNSNDKDSIVDSCDSTRVECDASMKTAQHNNVMEGRTVQIADQINDSSKVLSADIPYLLTSVKEVRVDELEIAALENDAYEQSVTADDNEMENEAKTVLHDNQNSKMTMDADNNHEEPDRTDRRMTRSAARGYVHTPYQPPPRAPRPKIPKNNNTSPTKSSHDRSKKGKKRSSSTSKDINNGNVPRRVTRQSESLPNTDGSNPGLSSDENAYKPVFPESKLPIPKICVTNNGNGHHCLIHEPSLEELESLNSFGSYIREVVLPAASMYEVDKNHPNYSPDFYMKTKMELGEGMALVRLPRKGFGRNGAR